VYKLIFFSNFFLQATTTFSRTVLKAPPSDDGNISTNANTFPTGVALFVTFIATFYSKATEWWATSKVNKVSVWHNNLQAKVASKLESGRRLLEYRFSGMTLAAKT